MARITVEDCLENLPNRFSLVLATAERAKQLLRDGGALVSNEDGNKEVVMALREIAAGRITVDDSQVRLHAEFLPHRERHRESPIAQALPPEADDALPPDADELLPPDADDALPAEA